MRLRLRLAVAMIAATVPMVVALLWADALARQQAAEDDLADVVLRRLDRTGERERCERRPAAWPDDGPPSAGRPPPEGSRPPGPPPLRDHRLPAELFAYDKGLRSQKPGAPAIEPPATAAEITSRSSMWNELRIELLIRAPWATGPCAFVLARGTKEPWLGALLPNTRIWLLPVVVMLAAVLLAVGPVIGRIRRLTREVERSAQSGYQPEVRTGGGDEVGDLARAFQAAGSEIRAQLADRERRQRTLEDFIADTTHDVMVPLTVLQGHLASLDRQAAAADRPVLVSAMDEAHYIGALLHNLAAIAKLEEDQASPRVPVDLGALLARVLARHRPIARQHQVALEGASPLEPIALEGDVTLLEQAVSNLVYNAVRHNRPGGHVAVLLEAEGASFRLRVIDDGPGVPAEDLSRLAGRGYRGDRARSRTPDGQGLGLDIVRRVAERHGLVLVLRASDAGGLEAELRPV